MTMPTHDCPACGGEQTVDEEREGLTVYDDSTTATCALCGARWLIEHDCDQDGDSYQDCSTLGERLKDSNPDWRMFSTHHPSPPPRWWSMSAETIFAMKVVAVCALMLAIACVLANLAGDPMLDPDCEPCPTCTHPYEDNQ